LIGFLVVAVGVFAEAADNKSGTKVIKITPKKPGEEKPKKPEGEKPGASDSEE